MATPNKKEFTHSFETPGGCFVFPWLSEPDVKFNAAGDFHCRVRFDPDDIDWVEFLEGLDGFLADWVEVQDPLVKNTYRLAPFFASEKKAIKDEDGNVINYEDTGYKLFKAKLRANVVYKDKDGIEQQFSQRPTVVDKDGNSITAPVYSESFGKLEGQAIPYVMPGTSSIGLSFRLFTVTVEDLVTGQERATATNPEGTLAGHSA